MTERDQTIPELPDRVEIAPGILVDPFAPGEACLYSIALARNADDDRLVVVSDEDLKAQIELDETIYGTDLPPRAERIRHLMLSMLTEQERLTRLLREQRLFAAEQDVRPEAVAVIEFNKERTIRFASVLGVRPD